MKRELSPVLRSAAYWVILTGAFVGILAFDLTRTPEHVAGALYVIPVLVAVLSGRTLWVVNTTIAAVAANALGYFEARIARG